MIGVETRNHRRLEDPELPWVNGDSCHRRAVAVCKRGRVVAPHLPPEPEIPDEGGNLDVVGLTPQAVQDNAVPQEPEQNQRTGEGDAQIDAVQDTVHQEPAQNQRTGEGTNDERMMSRLTSIATSEHEPQPLPSHVCTAAQQTHGNL